MEIGLKGDCVIVKVKRLKKGGGVGCVGCVDMVLVFLFVGVRVVGKKYV